MTCRFYGRCPRDRDTGEVLCHYGWRDDCPMDADDGGDYDEHADLDGDDETNETEKEEAAAHEPSDAPFRASLTMLVRGDGEMPLVFGHEQNRKRKT